MRKISVLLVPVLLLLLTGPAFAVVAGTDTVGVTVTVTPTYSFSVSPASIDLGSAHPGDPAIVSPGNVEINITSGCSGTGAYQLRAAWTAMTGGTGTAPTFGITRGAIGTSGPYSFDWNSGQAVSGTCKGLSTPDITVPSVNRQAIPLNTDGVWTSTITFTMEY